MELFDVENTATISIIRLPGIINLDDEEDEFADLDMDSDERYGFNPDKKNAQRKGSYAEGSAVSLKHDTVLICLIFGLIKFYFQLS